MMNSDSFNTAGSNGDVEWVESADGSRQFLRCWFAEKPLALVLYLHGIEGHSLWFKDTAAFLKENGISIFALDRRGSGLSEELRGDMKSWRQPLNDTSEALAYLNRRKGNLPLFLMANCWAAKTAVLLAQEMQGPLPFCGLILSSPALEVKVDLCWREKLLIAWRLCTGSREAIPIPLSVEDFTDNPQYIDFISGDKLRLTEATARFFFNTLLLTEMSKRSAEKITMPTLLLQSGTDSIVDKNGVAAWFQRLSSPDKRMELFPDTWHSLDFDSKPEKYRHILLDWILARIKNSRSEKQHENSLA